MAEFSDLQVYEDKAFEKVIVKDQINIEVSRFSADPKLTPNKGKSLAQFHEKVTQASNKSIFKLSLSNVSPLSQVKEFEDVGILKKMQWVGLLVNRYARLGSLQEALVATGLDLPCQTPRTPALPGGFFNIVITGLGIFYSHHQPPVAPTQFATQCVLFSCVRESQVELSKIPEVGNGHAPTKFLPKSTGEVTD